MTQESDATSCVDFHSEEREIPYLAAIETKRKPSWTSRFYCDPTRVNPSIFLNPEAENLLALEYIHTKAFEFLFQLLVQSIETRIIEVIGEPVISASRAECTKFKLPPLQCDETVWEFCKRNEFGAEFHALWFLIAKHFPSTLGIETSIYTDPELPEFHAIRFLLRLSDAPESILDKEKDFYEEALTKIPARKASLYYIAYDIVG